MECFKAKWIKNNFCLNLIHVFDASRDYSFLHTLDDHSSSITAVRFLRGQVAPGEIYYYLCFRQFNSKLTHSVRISFDYSVISIWIVFLINVFFLFQRWFSTPGIEHSNGELRCRQVHHLPRHRARQTRTSRVPARQPCGWQNNPLRHGHWCKHFDTLKKKKYACIWKKNIFQTNPDFL